MVLWPNAAQFVETKRPKGGRYEPLQLRIHAMLRKLNYVVVVLKNHTDVDEYIAKWKP